MFANMHERAMKHGPLESWFVAMATIFVVAGIGAGPAAYAWAYWTTSNSAIQPTPAMIANRLAIASSVAFLGVIAFFAGLAMFVVLAVVTWVGSRPTKTN